MFLPSSDTRDKFILATPPDTGWRRIQITFLPIDGGGRMLDTYDVANRTREQDLEVKNGH